MINKDSKDLKDLKGINIDERLIVCRGGDNRQKGPNAKAELLVTLEELY